MKMAIAILAALGDFAESILVLGLFVAVICHSMRLRDLEKK